MLYDINNNGYSILNIKWHDIAKSLKMGDANGGLQITTTPESYGVASPSKLDLKPEGTLVLALPALTADQQTSTTAYSKITLKGYIDGESIESKRK